jgi:hypothetical protein
MLFYSDTTAGMLRILSGVVAVLRKGWGFAQN